MKSPARIAHPQEIELKLALPTSDPQGLAGRLARTPLLARRQATQLQLHNIYFDTPAQRLHQERVALRLRRTGSEEKPQWLQTLKMGGRGDSALSQRGEWEVAVPGAELQRQALQATPWAQLDADGGLFEALAPCFVTAFERTRWLVRRRGGSVVEVALDIGQVVAGDRRAPICELELELLAGQPADLFEVAQQIARTVAVLPLNISKAERGYALLQDALNRPLRARPPLLTPRMDLPAAAQSVLREMFAQFTGNLNALRSADDPELVHQARVGWRRFRSAVRLFRPALAAQPVPAWEALRPLLTFVGEVRDLDVARTDTLAALADAYTAPDGADGGNSASAQRQEKWQAMQEALTQAAHLGRKSVGHALQAPAVGATLLAITQWLEELPGDPAPDSAQTKAKAKTGRKRSLRRWARQRIARLHGQMTLALQDTANPQSLHRARILSKRLRYGIEALHPLLPKRPVQRWLPQAIKLQTRIGATRDVQQAAALAASLGADPGLAEFLRGVAAGQARPG